MKSYTLLGSDNSYYESETPGLFGGHRKNKIYGELDCPSALNAIAKGGYIKNRVFFATEDIAVAAGYRPCGNCLHEKYVKWKETKKN
ncbi:metal-binding protein [Fictibacillus sp. KIGAM418]|uniref:Metal-binding protein n=1 Tax=Fictibacillus marinisediminis TaxID=2878389 RepID=A0A9X1X832_9BACL|nr:metal-binding protein [Fictibacillus marinisediminis]